MSAVPHSRVRNHPESAFLGGVRIGSRRLSDEAICDNYLFLPLTNLIYTVTLSHLSPPDSAVSGLNHSNILVAALITSDNWCFIHCWFFLPLANVIDNVTSWVAGVTHSNLLIAAPVIIVRCDNL